MRKQKTERAPYQESKGDLCNSRDHRPSAIYSGGGIWGKMECWFRRKKNWKHLEDIHGRTEVSNMSPERPGQKFMSIKLLMLF